MICFNVIRFRVKKRGKIVLIALLYLYINFVLIFIFMVKIDCNIFILYILYLVI